MPFSMLPHRALVLLLLLPSAAAAADPELRFRREFAPGQPYDVRRLALRRLVATPTEEVVPLLIEALETTRRHLNRLRAGRAKATLELAEVEAPYWAAVVEAQRAVRSGRTPSGRAIGMRERFDRAREELERAWGLERTERELRDALIGALAEVLDALGGSPAATRATDGLRAGPLASRSVTARLDVVRALGRAKLGRAARLLSLVAFSETDPAVLAAAADGLGAHREGPATDVLVDRLRHDSWRVRAAVAEALGRIGDEAAVEPLIELLERSPGRLREDATLALERITGCRLGPVPTRWRQWLVNRAAGHPTEDADDFGVDGASFYDIRTLSQRVIFVLDRSGSMDQPANPLDSDRTRTKLVIARRETRVAVMGLGDDALFNVVTFAHEIERLDRRRALIAADGNGRRRLKEMLDRTEALGPTNSSGALRLAFQIAGVADELPLADPVADTIFFLTDGQATSGPLLTDRALLDDIAWLNANARIRIHVVAVGPDVNEALLRRLAESAGGQLMKR